VPFVVAQPNKRMAENNANNAILHIFMIFSFSINEFKLNAFKITPIITGIDQTYYRQGKRNPLVLNQTNI
jgi:hypothetical protein